MRIVLMGSIGPHIYVYVYVYVYEVVEQKGFLEGGASDLILDKFSIFILNLSVFFLTNQG